MWRVAAKAYRSHICSATQTLQHQSHLSQVYLPSHCSNLISTKNAPFFLNLRFFSSQPSIHDAFESNGNPHISETMEAFDSISDPKFEASSVAPVEAQGMDPVVEEPIRKVDFQKLQNVLSLLQSTTTTEVGSLKSSLDGMNLDLHEEFVIRVLQTYLVSGQKLIAFFKWALEKPEFSVSSLSLHALVLAICSIGMRRKDAYALWDLIKETGDVVNTGILNDLISILSQLGKGKAALEVFDKFDEFGCVRDGETYYFTIKALCKRKFFDWASSVSHKMVSAGKLPPDSEKVGEIISYFCKGNKAKEAHSIYLLAKEGDRYPPQSSVNFLIRSLYCVDETVHLALEVLEDIPVEKRKYAIKPFMSVIHGLCRIKDIYGAKNLLSKMIDAGPLPGNDVFNPIIYGLSNAGDMVEARKLIKLMESRGLKPDVLTYSAVMRGYIKAGDMEAAREVLSEAKKKHRKLAPVTYRRLIHGYCKLGRFEEAVKLFREMKEFGAAPSYNDYNNLIESLCVKALDWETAQKLLNEMEETGLYAIDAAKALVKAVKEMGLQARNEEIAIAAA